MKENLGLSGGEDAHISALTGQIKLYGNSYPQEESTVAQFLKLLADGPVAFTRDRTAGHLTGSAVVLDPTGENTLLTHHAKLGIWLQLGGHADGDLDLYNVALQEASEESGLQRHAFQTPTRDIIDLDIHRIPARDEETAHLHYDVRFVFVTDRSLPTAISHESHDLRWVPLEEIRRFSTEESLLRALSRAKDAVRTSCEGTR